MYIMQAEKNNFKRVFYHSAIEWKDEAEEKFERARGVLTRIVGNFSEREAHDLLTSSACRDQKTHDDICLGLLATILTEPQIAPKCFRDLNFLSRDSLGVVIDQLVMIAVEKYQKLTDVSRSQLVWIVRELVRAGVNNVDLLCWNLMRQIAGGDVSNRNLWLAESMLDIYSENRSWLEKYPILIASVIYTYLRILEDHTTPSLSSLKQKEVNFLVGLIRGHFTDVCMNQQIGLGRDFLRLLQSVSRIPEIESLWKDIYGNPNSLDAALTGVHQLLNSRTSRKYLQSRLTPDMEKKIHFLTTQVKFGMQKRYQDWFQRQYLSTPESQTLRADIIRFIVGVIHPTNEVLCSDILPRWAVIGWLLTTCTHPVAAANAKLALFFDWLVYDPMKDNIMNIEPGILVMYHSLRPHPAITATLLDFLIRLSVDYWPAGADKIKDGIGSSLRAIVDKKVLQSLDLLLENPKLDADLRIAIQDRLLVLVDRNKSSSQNKLMPSYSEANSLSYSVSSTVDKDSSSPLLDIPSTNNNNNNSALSALSATTPPTPPSPSGMATTTLNNNSFAGSTTLPISSSQPVVEVTNDHRNQENLVSYANTTENDEDEDDPGFSPDEDEDDEKDNDRAMDVKENNHLAPTSALAGAIPTRNSPTIASSVEEAEKTKIVDIIISFPPGLRLPLNGMLEESSDDISDYLEEVLDDMDRSVDTSERQGVSKCLAYIYKSDLAKPCMLKDAVYLSDNYSLSPIQEIVKAILEIKQSDKSPKRKNLMKLLSDLINLVPAIGFKLLIVLEHMSRAKRPTKNQDHYPLLYKNLCQYRSLKLEAALLQDLKNCWEFEPNLVGFLCPILYTWYEADTVGSIEMLRIIVSALDPYQLQDNMWRILQSDFVILDDTNLIPVINKTLEWETWEQHCVWTMLSAHNCFTAEDYLPLIPQLDSKTNAEALTYLLLTLKHEKPTGDILGPLLCRKPNHKDRFVISLFLHWSDKEEEEETLADNLATVLVRASGSPVKRKRGGASGRGTASPAGPATPTLESVLAHLEQLRVSLLAKDPDDSGVFSKDCMQAALLQVQSWVTETQKSKYKDLLELAAIEEPEMKEISSSSSSRSGSKRNSSARGTPTKMPASPTPTTQITSRTRSQTSGKTTKARPKDDYDESSDEEDLVRPRNAKKRKKREVSSDESD